MNSSKEPSLKPHKKMSLPIAWRVATHVAGTGVLLCLTVLLSLLPFQYGRVEQEAITEARILAEAVSTIYQRLGSAEPLDQARRLLLRVARTPHISMVHVLDQDGVVRYSTDSRELGKKTTPHYGVLREDDYFTVTHVVADTDSEVSGVSVVIERDLLMSDIHRLFAQIGISLFVMIVILAFLVKGVVERIVSARLAKLMDLIENAEAGSFLIRAPIDRNDEIGHVILGFNQLLGVITQIEARHLEKEHGLKDAEIQKSMRIKLEETLFQLERSNERLKSKVSAQELLMEAAHRLGGTLKREAVVDRLIALIEEKLSWPQFAFFLVEEKQSEKPYLKLAKTFGVNETIILPSTKVDVGEGVIGIAAQTGAPVLLSNLEKEQGLKLWAYQSKSIYAADLNQEGSLMAVPMIHKGRVIGIFLFLHPELNKFSSDDVTLISALGAQTALAIVNAELYEKTLLLATSDPLTGVLNRRAMVKQIEDELARVQRFDTNVALLLIDVDHFKGYNDRMGHVLGDVALKEIAKSLGAKIRKVDTLARFGGEEFCVILPQTDGPAAREVAAKLCEAVRSLKLRGVEKQELGHLSVSIGIAVVPGAITDLDSETAVTDVVAAADQALYEAKRLGRDRFMEFIPA